jgi:hypothetical protein
MSDHPAAPEPRSTKPPPPGSDSEPPEPSGDSRASDDSATVMLVRVEPSDEAALQLGAFVVLRGRYPLQVCERIRVTRPLAVVVGRGVRDDDVERLTAAARRVSCDVVAMDAFVSPSVLRETVRRAIARARARRG